MPADGRCDLTWHLRLISPPEVVMFVSVHNLSLSLFAPPFIYILFSSACNTVYIFVEIGYRSNFVIYPCIHCI